MDIKSKVAGVSMKIGANETVQKACAGAKKTGATALNICGYIASKVMRVFAPVARKVRDDYQKYQKGE